MRDRHRVLPSWADPGAYDEPGYPCPRCVLHGGRGDLYAHGRGSWECCNCGMEACSDKDAATLGEVADTLKACLGGRVTR